MKWRSEREPRAPAWKRIPRSLRFRLAFSFVIFFAIVLAGVGFVFRETLRQTLENHARDILNEEYVSIKGYLRIEHHTGVWYSDPEDPEEAAFVQRLRRVILVTEPDGHVLEASDAYITLGVDSPEEIRRVLAAGKTDWTVRANSRNVPYLVRRSSLIDDRKQYFLAIGRPVADDQAITRAFTLNYLALLPLLLLAASVMGWFFAGPPLQPVIEVAATAQRISGENLALRIPRRGSGDELDHLIDTFNSMMDRLDASFQQSRQFSANVSHELRTPLTVIRGQLEVALFTAQTIDQYRDAVVNALQDVERLTHIVKTLLLLSQAEAGHLALQRVALDLSDLVRDIVDEFQIPADEAQVTLTAETPPGCFIAADRVQMERLLTNLLSNAVKYTRPGGSVRAGVRRVGDRVELTVADNGIGIPAGHLPHIFDRFFRVPDPEVRAERGLGLGLSFVAWIVKAHDGLIDVESEPGKGTRFIIRLPAANHEAAGSDVPAIRTAALPPGPAARP